ncbi:TetR/AcrR family transcriptional regulator [Microlunatus antarcticus]|uniref:AcrR family transcriptional regulator n=1 Tax=Microlunatus antarcticus TaxID=53388 RepID=A0A7W5P8H5_9ACTN|nr:TetR/AcrR family transcriptional regulator [Microlunatus antarcticus]MBB3327921.1 AcrR family transcriptional regulator [Microlunatus antarcticus]
MGRRPQPDIRERLLDACTDHALAHGLPDRLEPFTRATGASARVLIYHFGTRDALLRAVLGQARRRQVELYGDLLSVRPGEAYTDTLLRFWTSMTGPDGQPYLRLFGPLRESAEQRLWPGFRRVATTDWLGPLEEGLRSLGRPDLATLVLAVVRGLLADLDATGDAERTDRAFRAFLDAIEPRAADGQRAPAATSGPSTASRPSASAAEDPRGAL